MSKAKSATYGDYHIRIDEQGTVKVYQKSTHKECPSAIAALREIANKIGYRYGDWNTRHFGAKLVEYLSSNPQLINVETPKVTTPKEEVNKPRSYEAPQPRYEANYRPQTTTNEKKSGCMLLPVITLCIITLAIAAIL